LRGGERGDGHEVSILIRVGDGERAGRAPSKVSTMIIRPPQQGQRRPREGPSVLGSSKSHSASAGEASGAAVFWAQIYGVRKDDVEELRLIAPDGRVLAERRTSAPRNRAQSLAYIGLRRRGTAWPAGTYRGEYALYRGGPQQKLFSLAREARIP